MRRRSPTRTLTLTLTLTLILTLPAPRPRFKDIAKDEEKFDKFTKNFGRYIKVGLIEDKDNKDALLSLASFASSDDSVPERGTTIPEYKARMKEGQKQIYYVSGAWLGLGLGLG